MPTVATSTSCPVSHLIGDGEHAPVREMHFGDRRAVLLEGDAGHHDRVHVQMLLRIVHSQQPAALREDDSAAVCRREGGESTMSDLRCALRSPPSEPEQCQALR